MARPRNADGQRTRQAILDAALVLFADKGFFGTSLRDVAGAVGVRESALYNYFKSKEALFEALILADQHTKIERLAATADGPITDGRAVLEELAIARSGRINLFERMGDGRARLNAVLRRLIREGWLREADPQLLAFAFTGPLLIWRQLHAINVDLPVTRNVRKFARLHVDQFLLGAAAPSTRPPRPARSRRASSSQGVRA
jgi:AcrR family transcriptional regulator